MPFVLKFSDGSYNLSNAETGANGFPVTLSEATRYVTRDAAEPLAEDLRNPDGTGVEIVEVSELAADSATAPLLKLISALRQDVEAIRRENSELEAKLSDALGTAGILYHALDDASSVVDKGDDEDYAYQAELETGAALLGIQRG